MKKYYLSIDIEREGDAFHNPVIAIGACFGPADGSWPHDKLLRFRGNLKPLPGDQPEALCMAEFWSQFAAIHQEIQAAAEEPAVVMTKFLNYCQQLVALYEDAPGADGKIVLVSDCPD